MSDVVHRGVHGPLERAADELIFGSLRGITSQEAKSDILTPWKEQDRHAREVLSRSGTIDPAIRRGMYHRVANTRSPHLNSRDGVTRPIRVDSGLAEDDSAPGRQVVE